ncbi:MAG: IS1 family transposase [Pyrinomonadaceae bacterium]
MAFPTFGKPTNRSFRLSSITRAEKNPAKRRTPGRWNNTLRQRLARFVRKTLSFSKSDAMHEICLFLFLHRYNNELALSLD